jgi:hypothetical protein
MMRMIPTKTVTLLLAMLVITLAWPPRSQAEAWAKVLTPARDGMPLANPITTEQIPPPPLSLMKDRPVNPAYVPGLPGLPQNKPVLNDYGIEKPKYDGIIIRQSRVQDGHVIIPPGGWFTWKIPGGVKSHSLENTLPISVRTRRTSTTT